MKGTLLLLSSIALFSVVALVPSEFEVSTTSPDVAIERLTTASPYASLTEITPQPQYLVSIPRTNTEEDVDRRFAGLLAHVHWLLERQKPAPITASAFNSNRSFFDRQIERVADDQIDDLRALTDDLAISLGTNALTVGTTADITGSLTVAGTTTLSNLTANSLRLPSLTPTNTTNLLYNTAGDLYWQGNLIAGGTVGNWVSSAGDVYRLTGNVGVGTNNPLRQLHLSTNVTGAALTQIALENTSTSTGSGSVISFRAPTTGVGARDFVEYAGVAGGIVDNNDSTLSGRSYLFSIGGLNYHTAMLDGLGNFGVGFPFSATSTPARLSVRGAGTGTGLLAQFTDSANTPRMTILDNGNVGIGTSTSLNDKLTIYENVDGGLLGQLIRNPNTGPNAFAQSSVSAGSAPGVSTLWLYSFGNNYTSINQRYAESSSVIETQGINGLGISSLAGPIRFFTLGDNERLTIASNGNVGIGTSTPERPLSIYSGFSAPVQVGGTGGTGSLIQFTHGVSSVIQGYLGYINHGATGIGILDASGSGASAPFLVTGSGNVGIGTTTPGARLDVAGTIRSYTPGSQSSISQVSSGGVTWDWNTFNTIDLKLSNDASGGRDALTILGNTGNVGIGTNNPTDKLRVLSQSNAPSISANAASAFLSLTQGASAIQRGTYSGLFISDNSGINNYNERMLGSASEVYAGLLLNADQSGGTPTNWNGTILSAQGLSAGVNNFTTGTGVINEATGIYTGVGVAGTGVIRNAYGLRISEARAIGVDPGQTHNAYGLFIDDNVIASGGSVNNAFALFSSSTANTFFAGSVGIGTTSPRARLDVAQVNTGDPTIISQGILRIENPGDVAVGNGIRFRKSPTEEWSIGGSNADGVLTDDLLIANQDGGAWSDRVVITASGNVGVGTVTPTQKLTVDGTFRAGQVGGGNNEITITDLGVLRSNKGSTNYQSHFIASNGNYDNVGSITTDGSVFNLSTGGFPRLNITQAGDVGIGTLNPANKLDVVGNIGAVSDNFTIVAITSYANAASPALLAQRARGTQASPLALQAEDTIFDIQARGYNGTAFDFTASHMIVRAAENFTSTNQGSYVAFQTVPNGTVNGVERLRITDGGNVGIGISNPSARLTVVGGDGLINLSVFGDTDLGAGGDNAAVRITSSSGTAPRLIFNGAAVPVGQTAIFGNIGSTSNLRFFTAASERMIIDGSGNVGIGTTTPSSALHIVGDVNISTPGDSVPNTSGRLVISGDGNQFISLNSIDNSGSTGVRFGGAGDRGSIFADGSYNITIEPNAEFGQANVIFNPKNGTDMNIGIATTTPSARLTVSGTVRFATITGGTLQTDSLGNVTASSDERLKDIDGDYTAGLEAILGLTPIQYNWNEESGYDTETLYAGFSAQNVQEFLPAAVGQNPDGFLTLSDRPIIAALVNAVKELWTDVESLLAWREQTNAELEYLRSRVESLENALNAVPPAPPATTPVADEPVEGTVADPDPAPAPELYPL